jgi:hypothetical protein
MAKAKKRTLYAKKTGMKLEREAREIYVNEYNKLMREQDSNGKVPRGKLKEKMTELGIWNQEIEDLQTKANENLESSLAKIDAGGITLEEAKEVALQAQVARAQLSIISNSIAEHDELWSFEASAEEVRTCYIIVNSVFYKDDDSPVFESMQEFHDCEDDELINDCIKKLNSAGSVSNDEYYRSLPEVAFLLDYGFLNEDLEVIEEDKDEKFSPFLDSDGNPVQPVEKKEEG